MLLTATDRSARTIDKPPSTPVTHEYIPFSKDHMARVGRARRFGAGFDYIPFMTSEDRETLRDIEGPYL